MRLLGVDYGMARVGLAVADTDLMMAFPLSSLPAVPAEDLIAGVAAVADAESAVKIVVGIPSRLAGGGEPGETERAVAAFIEALKSQTQMDIVTEDERLTTALVEKERRAAGIKSKDFDRDAAAAAAILETYMERNKPDKEDSR